MEESVFKNDAKVIVDMLFQAKLFRDDLTRDDLNTTEDFIKSCMQSRHDSHLKASKIFERLQTYKKSDA